MSTNNAEPPQHESSMENLRNTEQKTLDCGITSLGWCKSSCCQKLARLSVFVSVLIFSGFLQGFTESYFRLTVLQLTHFNSYPKFVVGTSCVNILL